MSEFRIMLLVLGIVVIFGIYLWGVGFDRKKLANRLTSKTRKKDKEPMLDTPAINPKEEEFDYTDVFSSQGGLKRDDDTESANPSPSPDAGVETATAPAHEPEVIVLYVTASEGAGFNGGKIRDVLYAAGMTHGDMQIFHHYGLGQSVSKTSIFSLANMMEPGTFDLDHIDDLQTSGVVLFMQLPTPIDPAIAFEHMLSTAQRLGEVLQGRVRDQKRQALTSKTVEEIRARVASYQQESPDNVHISR